MGHFIPKKKLTNLILSLLNDSKMNKYGISTETIQILQLFSEKFIGEIFDKSKKICLHKKEDTISKEDIMYVLEEMGIIFGNKKVWSDAPTPSKNYVDKYNDAPKY